jgi:hypothetical protein
MVQLVFKALVHLKACVLRLSIEADDLKRLSAGYSGVIFPAPLGSAMP